MHEPRQQLDDFARRAWQSDLFSSSAALTLARAPGRLDVMGGIADYSGSLVLEMPIREAAFAAVQQASDGQLIVRSGAREVRLLLAELRGQSYDGARKLFRQEPERRWAAYVAGALVVLERECRAALGQGLRILLASSVPEGTGVSSSAAIEVATLQAVASALGIEVAPVELALLCQKLENLVVGAPCGVMDQITSACGEQGRLLELSCQPASILGQREIPAGIAFFGIDSGLRHAVTGADYGQVRTAAFMGKRIVDDLAGPKAPAYLADISPSVWLECHAAAVPETMLGRDFVVRYGRTSDTVTRVEPDVAYPVRAATAHPIFENARVKAFSELCGGDLGGRRLELLGELMFESHLGYSACGLGSSGTDQLVSLVREAGAGSGVYGAKITGGGSGGTVAILGRADALPVVEHIARRYAEASGRQPYVFSGSSPGAAAFGVHRAASDRAPERVR
jgi:galactokinase